MSKSAAEVCNCSALRQAARHVSRNYDEALAPVGLGLNQFTILARLDRLGPRTIQCLARNLVMDRSTLGHLVRPLHARGLLSMQACETDRRSRMIALTKGGKALLLEARPLWAGAQRRFETGFGSDSARHLREVLKRVEVVDFGEDRASSDATSIHERS